MSQVIRIPENIYNRLEKLAIGFDIPASVIERLLDFYEKYHHERDDISTVSFESKSLNNSQQNNDTIEIRIRNARAKKKYALIPLSDDIRYFFPGYKIPFNLKTDIGDFETKVTSAPKGTKTGDPEAGTYIQGGLKPWFDSHRSLSDGDILVINKLAEKLYKLKIKE